MKSHLLAFRGSFFLLFFALLLPTTYYLLPTRVFAASNFTVSPVVIDGKGKQREILRYTTTVTNTTKHLFSIYPWVIDVDGATGETGSGDLGGAQNKDVGESLARWIEVTRGSIDLLPGEHKDIPITVQINLNAKPGMYHALIHMSEGGDRATAEANKTGTTDIAMNIEVLEDINERMQLGTFSPDKNIFAGDQASFQYRLENIGNRGVIPHGKIHIYDRRGEEVATIDANQDGKKLEPSSKEMLASVWASGGNFGRYKAMLDLEYGARGTLQDTVFFWVLPWKKLLGMFLSLLILCVIFAIVFHSRLQAKRGGTFVPARATDEPPWGPRSRFAVDSEDESNSMEHSDNDRSRYRRSIVRELREVEPPPPVRTRLFSRLSSPEELPTQLEHRGTEVLHGHQVRLEKREGPKPSPHHIVRLTPRK